MGARAKHFNYFEKEDIGYYNVPTPFTEIFAKSTFWALARSNKTSNGPE